MQLSPTQTFTFDPLTEDVDLPDELANISLTAASLVLRVDNGAGMPAQIVMTVTGTAEDGSKATLDLAAYIAPATEQDPLQTVVVLDQTNSDIVPFLNNKPETITLEGDVLVGGETVIGTIRPGDYAVLSWEISAPLEVIIAETIIAGNPDQLDLGEDTKELISDHAMSARMIAEVTNHLPVAVDLTIYVSDDTLTMTSDPLLTVRLMDVAAGQLDPLLHTVSAPTVSRPEINLTREEILVFGLRLPDRGLFTLLEVTLPGSGDPVRLRATDYLQVNGLVSLEIRTTD